MSAPAVLTTLPPRPRALKGRAQDLRTLTQAILTRAPTRLALVGAGGSGKSMLACALGHRLSARFHEQVHWFRVGAWDFHTLAEMLALAFGTSLERARLVPELTAFLRAGPERLIFLDNHENDQATAKLLETFAGAPVTFVITARRCLLGGVLVFPVTPPLVTVGEVAFKRVAGLTRILRWNPLALDIADAIVASRAATSAGLARFLEEKQVERVRVIEHEDDLPEVALLLAWAWQRLAAESRRVLGLLSHIEGDHMDLESITRLAKLRSPERALAPLRAWHLIQEPRAGRYTLHAVVRHATRPRAKYAPERTFEHYVSLLERHPERLALEYTHLFSAMDHAHRNNDFPAMQRVERLLQRLGYG